ncbi:hypothetical protein MP638_005562 [Amoeboaphelidium occidentale]|nr:hypothetical protein MP638_005562 [Amoeboaphelidium occidentale]
MDYSKQLDFDASANTANKVDLLGSSSGSKGLRPTSISLQNVILQIRNDLVHRKSPFVSNSRHYTLQALRADTTKLYLDPSSATTKLIERLPQDMHFRFRLNATGELPAYIDETTEFVLSPNNFSCIDHPKQLEEEESTDGPLGEKAVNVVNQVVVTVEVLSEEAKALLFDPNSDKLPSIQLYHDLLYLWALFEQLNTAFEANSQLSSLKETMFLPHTIPPSVTGIDRRFAALLWGPPGTGKSTITRGIIEKCGVHPVWFGTVAELKRPYVGETKAVIKKLVNRCKLFPHLLCCLVMDEIDTLAPKRSDPGQPAHKQDWLSLLLRIMDSEDYPNLLIIGSTNRKFAMDEAVLRPGRMDSTFMFGRLRGDEIVSLIRKLAVECETSVKGIEEPQKRLHLMSNSINFTGAMVKRCFQTVFTRKYLAVGKFNQLPAEELILEFKNIQEPKLLVPLAKLTDKRSKFYFPEGCYKSAVDALNYVISVAPRYVAVVDSMSLDQNMPFPKSIQGLLEEAVESSKTGGAVIVIDLDGLFYPTLKKSFDLKKTRYVHFEEFLLDYSRNQYLLFGECTLFATRQSTLALKTSLL